MAAEHADPVEREEELDAVILAYVEAVEAGQSPDRAAWLARYPHLARELSAFFADQDRFSAAVSPIRVDTPPPSGARTGLPSTLSLPDAPALPPGTAVGDYEVLEEVARGGMGVVYKARHRTLGRLVALKMIRSGSLALPEDVQRFRLEAEAAALLDHPNIVPIYDVGEHDGRPYYSMKLIDGGNLAQWVAGPRRVAVRELVEIMVGVARAVHYAHQRGILHRDLKPANVLLDRRGEPHVTDFGLATRLAGDPSGATVRSLTAPGVAVGTPSYMAPEQANGPKRSVTVAADVYSLGAVLYELLTGVPPFRGETALETLVQVLHEPPRPPRALVPSVPRDLETICLRCLEKEPGRRYPSAAALADDLQRYLDGEPIAARPVGTAERLWRWCRRSPVVAFLAASLLLLAGFGLVAVTFLWQRAEYHWKQAEEQRELAGVALKNVEEQRRQAEEQRAVADEQRRRADEQRREAEESFRQAHEIVERLCMRVSEERLSAFQGLQPLRKEMLEAGLEYYQLFLKKHGDDPALKADLAKAHFRLASLTSLVGSKRDALASYRKAMATYEELLAADPNNAHYREQIAMTCINAGGLQEAVNDRKAALASYERARDLLEALDREKPGEHHVLSHLGAVYTNMGNVCRGLNRPNDSATAYEKALAALERLARDDPHNPKHQRDLAVVYVNVAILCSTHGDRDEAMHWHQKARDLQEALHRDHPKNNEIKHDLALTRRRIGERLVRDGKAKDGLDLLEKGHELLQELAAANPSVTEYQWELALSLRAQAQARRSCADPKKVKEEKARAAEEYREAADLLRKALRQDPSVAVYRRDLAATLFDLGVLLAGEGQKAEAARAYAQAAEVWRDLAHPGPDVDALIDLGTTCNNLGIVQRDTQHPAEALAAFTEARAAREELVRVRPDEPRFWNDLASTLGNLAQIQGGQKKRDDEIASFERARAIRERLVREHPGNVTFHNDLGTTLINLGYSYARADRLDDSLSALRRAVAEKQTAYAADPKSPDYQRGLNNAYGALAEVERVKGTPAESAKALLERRKLWPDEPQELYRIAREQAMTAAAVARDRAEPTAEERAERARYLDDALETLRQAVKAGFKDADRLHKEADFAPLRSRDEFQKLLPGAKK